MRAKKDGYLFRDNPMFVSVMEDKQIAKHVLETVIGRKVADIEYADTEKRHDLGPSGGSIRMDVYLEDREGKAYDVEMQTYAEDDLELRLRRYQSTMDSQTLKPSSRERSLKGSYIIFLCTFDPFGLGLAKYSFERTCQEDRGLVLDTRAHWLVAAREGPETRQPATIHCRRRSSGRSACRGDRREGQDAQRG